MRTGFQTDNLSFRGTEIAVLDYAPHNQSLLQNESFFFYKSKRDLQEMLLGFSRRLQYVKNWTAYRNEFSPQAVISKVDDELAKGLNINSGAINAVDKPVIADCRLGWKMLNFAQKNHL